MQRLTARGHPACELLAGAALAAALTAGCAAAPQPTPARQPAAPRSPATAGEPATAAPHPARCTLETLAGEPELSPPPGLENDPAPSPANALAWVRLLADPALRGRRSASAQERAVARLLARAVADHGFRALRADGELCQTFPAPGGVDQNVVAGFGLENATAFVLVGAHYDALGTTAAGAVYPGADDDASGVAALLELARTLPRRPRAPDEVSRTGVVLVFFGGEEAWLYGSRHFVADPWVPLDRMRAMVNLDMVGRQLLEGQSVRWLLGNPRDALGYVLGGGGGAGTALHAAARAAGVEIHGIPESVFRAMGYGADSVPFTPHAPTVFISSSMHDDYHRVTDTPDRVDPGQIARAARLTTALIETLARDAPP